jgi:hypothetical protein
VVWTVIGTVAAVLAAVVTLLAYRSTVPRVSVRAGVLPSGPHEGSLCIEVLNGGSSETTIDFYGISFKRTPGFAPLDEALGMKRRNRVMPLELTGLELPYRLPGHDGTKWFADLARINWDLEHNLGPEDRGVVLLRVGARRRRARIRHYEMIMATKAYH